MLEATCYILKGKEPVPCDDIVVWQEFMDNDAERTLGSNQAGRFGVHTTFVGVNLGSEIMPKFFRTIVTGDNGDNDPWLSETWEQAEVTHRTVVEASTSLTNSSQGRKADNVSGYRVVDYSIVPDGLRFVMESEEAAVQMIPLASKNWSREGRTVTFHAF